MEEFRTHSTEARQLLSVVMPVFGEGAHLPAFLAAVRTSLDRCNLSYELLLVDDGSPDDTWHTIEVEANRCHALLGLRLSRNLRNEPALCAGFDHALVDTVII